MPMDFPDLKSLRNSYDHAKGVPYKEGTSEADYREQCARHAETVYKDPVEAMEVRSKKGWDRWDDKTATEAVTRHPDPMSNPMLLGKMVDKINRHEKRQGN